MDKERADTTVSPRDARQRARVAKKEAEDAAEERKIKEMKRFRPGTCECCEGGEGDLEEGLESLKKNGKPL